MENTASPSEPRRRLPPRPVIVVFGLVLVVLAAAAAFWFQPWTLVTNTTVNDAVPTASPLDSPVVLSEGQFVSQEHETSGTAKLLRLSDGSNVVRLENLNTSEGPEVKVLLTDAPVVATSEGYRVFEDGRHVDLGALRGNIGNANYAVPADADINGLDSVSIWCARFDVSFGAAKLTAAPPTN